MRISRHADDLLVTDQSIGLGAMLAAAGALIATIGLGRLFGDDGLGVSVALVLVGALCIKLGLDRLVAMQLIVDMDAREVVAKHWSFTGATTNRIPFQAVEGFSIEPQDAEKRTQLVIETSRGPVLVAGGAKVIRPAWEEVVVAVEHHMGRRPSMGGDR